VICGVFLISGLGTPQLLTISSDPDADRAPLVPPVMMATGNGFTSAPFLTWLMAKWVLNALSVTHGLKKLGSNLGRFRNLFGNRLALPNQIDQHPGPKYQTQVDNDVFKNPFHHCLPSNPG
jgi:hypothetical protein